jgi:hypothetical protein
LCSFIQKISVYLRSSPDKFELPNFYKGEFMNENEMLNFARALADADRLRIIGLLTQRSASLTGISADLGFHPADTRRHLEQLLQGGIVRSAEGFYELDTDALEKLARRQFEGERGLQTPETDPEKDRRKVLAAYLKADGTLRQIPADPARRQVILDYLINAFSVGANYSEKEVNLVLAQFHPDTAALRRALVDAGMLARERNGSRYWRPA